MMKKNLKQALLEEGSSRSSCCLKIQWRMHFLNIHRYKDDFLEGLTALDGEWPWIEANTKRQEEQVVVRLKTGKVLNQMLRDYRQRVLLGKL